MKFGSVAVEQAIGAVLAHSVKTHARRLRKGKVLDQADLADLLASGITDVTVARLEAGDIDENAAALKLAQAIVPDPNAAHLQLTKAFTGRVNLIAEIPGIAQIDTNALSKLNGVNAMITCATVQPYARLEAGAMAATIKIISYAVPADEIFKACDAARASVRMLPCLRHRVELVVTDTGSGPDDTKGIAAIGARIERLGGSLEKITKVRHDTDALAAALKDSSADLVLILTASATSDAHDTAPAALIKAGGELTRFGMPVDPGNLLFLGQFQEIPVIGLPGCARSPALNGADWILERVMCGVDVSSQDIAQMGVGGLLKEIPQRPQPRRG